MAPAVAALPETPWPTGSPEMGESSVPVEVKSVTENGPTSVLPGAVGEVAFTTYTVSTQRFPVESMAKPSPSVRAP